MKTLKSRKTSVLRCNALLSGIFARRQIVIRAPVLIGIALASYVELRIRVAKINRRLKKEIRIIGIQYVVADSPGRNDSNQFCASFRFECRDVVCVDMFERIVIIFRVKTNFGGFIPTAERQIDNVGIRLALRGSFRGKFLLKQHCFSIILNLR